MNQIVVRITSQRGGPDRRLLASHMPGGTLEHGDIVFTTSNVDADVVVVLNYLKYDQVFTARAGHLWNWHNEPIVRKPFPRGFDKVFTHLNSHDPRASTAPPILDWWIGKSWDELSDCPVPEKRKLASVIASTKEMIEGHRQRNEFIRELEEDFPHIDVFGAGRCHELDDKWDGLAAYRYSIAIENTSKRDYWTEKIADCFLAYTVPIYFGATNIADYFPEESFVWLPLENPSLRRETLYKILEHDSWEARLPAIEEARQLVLNQYSLFGQLTSKVRASLGREDKPDWHRQRVHGRRTRPGGWVRGQGLFSNLENQVSRLASRLKL